MSFSLPPYRISYTPPFAPFEWEPPRPRHSTYFNFLGGAAVEHLRPVSSGYCQGRQFTRAVTWSTV